MRLPPADVLLDWPTPNYADPVTRGNALLIVNAIFLSLAVITVALRLYTRIVIKRWFGIDDIFIILALVFTAGLAAIVLLANQSYGWNRHVWDIPFDQFPPTSKIAMAAKLVFVAAASFTRFSLLCFYYRLISDSGKEWFKWLIHANVVYNLGIFISFPFIGVFQCVPVSNYWMVGAPEGTCMDEGVATLICGIMNCAADLTTTITPMPLVFRLNMPSRQRIAVVILFSLGFVVTIAGVVRTWYIYKSLMTTWDTTWHAYPLWIAAAIEIDLGVICASAPVLRPLLSMIPFSLSASMSRGISLAKRSTGCTSDSNPTPKASHVAPAGSVASSARRLEAPRSVPELANDRGKSYELKQWDDIEQQAPAGRSASRGSDEHIMDNVNNEDDNEKNSGGLWKKMTAKREKARSHEDMTITLTSEIETEIEPAHCVRSNDYRELRPPLKIYSASASR